MSVTIMASETWHEGEADWLVDTLGSEGLRWKIGDQIDDCIEMIFEREEDAMLYTLKWCGNE